MTMIEEIKGNYLPKWNHGERLLRALIAGSLRLDPNNFKRLEQNSSSIARPAEAPGFAQSTGPTVMSTSSLLSSAFQSMG
jgi:hypothetical protein